MKSSLKRWTAPALSKRLQLGWFVYILECGDQSLYTGITNDLARRLLAHNRKKGGRYTRAHAPMELVYSKKCRNRSDALKKEYQIKRLKRSEKLALIRRVRLSRP